MAYTIMLSVGLHIVLDVVLMYNLLALVVIAQDAFGTVTKREETTQPTSTATSYKAYAYDTTPMTSSSLLSPPPTDTSLRACIRSLRV